MKSKFNLTTIIFFLSSCAVLCSCVSTSDLDKFKTEMNQKLAQQNSKMESTLSQQDEKITKIEKLEKTVQRAFEMTSQIEKKYKDLDETFKAHQTASQKDIGGIKTFQASLSSKLDSAFQNLSQEIKKNEKTSQKDIDGIRSFQSRLSSKMDRAFQNLSQEIKKHKSTVGSKFATIDRKLLAYQKLLQQLHYYQYRLFSLIESQCVPGSEIPSGEELVILKATWLSMKDLNEKSPKYRLSITVKKRKGIELFTLVIRDLEETAFHNFNQQLSSHRCLLIENQKNSQPQIGSVVENARMVYLPGSKMVKFVHRTDLSVMEGASSVKGFYPPEGYEKASKEFHGKVKGEGAEVK